MYVALCFPLLSLPYNPIIDECATNLLSLGRSYYMPLWFMRQEPAYRKYLDFSAADGATPEDEMQWARAFLFLLKKVNIIVLCLS